QEVVLASATDDPYLVVPLSSGGRVSGVVKDGRGQVLEGAEVRLSECGGVEACPHATTDERGAFLLHSIPEERPFSVTARHRQHGGAVRPDRQVGPGERLPGELQRNRAVA